MIPDSALRKAAVAKMQKNARLFNQAMTKPEFAMMATGYGLNGKLPKTRSAKLLVSQLLEEEVDV